MNSVKHQYWPEDCFTTRMVSVLLWYTVHQICAMLVYSFILKVLLSHSFYSRVLKLIELQLIELLTVACSYSKLLFAHI